MRRQNHLQELQQNERQAQYRVHKQNEREERVAAARQGGSTQTETVRQHARKSKAKKGFESGLVRLHGVPFQPKEERPFGASVRLPDLALSLCPRTTCGPHGRLALVPQGCNRPCSQAFPQQERSFPSRQIPKLTVFSTIHSAKYWKSWISLLPFLNYDFAFHLFLSFSTFIAFSSFPF